MFLLYSILIIKIFVSKKIKLLLMVKFVTNEILNDNNCIIKIMNEKRRPFEKKIATVDVAIFAGYLTNNAVGNGMFRKR